MNSGKNILKPKTEEILFKDLAVLIEQSQKQVAVVANSTVVYLYWQIGKRINTEILKNKRADYAKEIVSTVSTQLKTRYGKSFELRNVRRMMQFAGQFVDEQIVVTLSRQLSWSHIIILLPHKSIEAKLLYEKIVNEQCLSVR